MGHGPAERTVALLAWTAIAGGLVILIGATLWWASFYADIVAQQPNGSLSDALPCLYTRKHACFIADVARAGGRMAYSPTVFWLGATSVLAGAAGRLWLMRAS